MDQPYFFLSYSRQDGLIMRRIADDLSAAGLDTWSDQRLEPGTPMWTSAIEDAIDGAACLVALLSPNAKKSDWVKRELMTARDQEIRIIPLLLRGEESSAVPFQLRGIQLLDIRRNYSEELPKLVQILVGERDRQIREWEALDQEREILWNDPEIEKVTEQILEGRVPSNWAPAERPEVRTGISASDLAGYFQNKDGNTVVGKAHILHMRTAYLLATIVLKADAQAIEGPKGELVARGWEYKPPGGEKSMVSFQRSWPMWEEASYLLEISREILEANRVLGVPPEEISLPIG